MRSYGATLIRADNPGPMTLEGTNTWLVGVGRVLVVDPGPDDEGHLRAVLEACGARLGGVLVTHRHLDHCAALASPVLRAAVAAAAVPVLAVDPSLGTAPDPYVLATTTDEPVELLPAPGHTDDSVALVLPRQRAVLTGDTVLGRGTSVVAHPDGDLTDHLGTLRRLRERVAEGGWAGLPGHGPVVEDLRSRLEDLLAHRRERLAEVRAALAGAGPGLTEDRLVDHVVSTVYPDLADPVLVAAAGRTVRATLVHLRRQDEGTG